MLKGGGCWLLSYRVIMMIDLSILTAVNSFGSGLSSWMAGVTSGDVLLLLILWTYDLTVLMLSFRNYWQSNITVTYAKDRCAL